MFQKLKSIGVFKSEYDGINTIENTKMDNKKNYLISDEYFNSKGEYETVNDYNRRIDFYKFILSKGMKGDIAKVLAYMQMNKEKLGVTYTEEYENALDKLQKLYLQK